jgi:hypothetical protein
MLRPVGRPSETTPNADCFGVGWYRHTNSRRKLVRPRHETHECCWRLCVDDSERLMVRLTKKLTAMLNEQPGTSALTFYWTQRAR